MIADDFLVAGFGSTDKKVNNSLEGHERAFLEKCRLWNLKLNGAKVKQHQLSVKFTGNQLTSRPKAQLEKIQAKLQWPQPEDGTALKRFLGMVTYLAKFMPHFSEMTTEPLRRLEDKNVEFQWLPHPSLALNTIQKFLTEAPVLRYYDVSKPITVQCDSSQSGLGVVLLQDGQPVCYASRANASGPTKVQP